MKGIENHLYSLIFCILFNHFQSYHYKSSSLSPNTLFKTSNTRIFSFGDPDVSISNQFMRVWQQFTRLYDNFIYPNELDIPGLTYATPVEWAPWLETVWFGNYYDYRTAFFQDVMYSNMRSFREGALLVKDSKCALEVALLYQRYPLFNPVSSYTISNATFFNLFAVQSLRLGRYKVPLTNEVILCVSDPLTYSDIKRYLNSFAALKWFRSQFLQQKRKRQYIMNMSPTNKNSTSSTSSNILPLLSSPIKDLVSRTFFSNAIYKIEYGKMFGEISIQNRKGVRSAYTIPILKPTLSLNSSECVQQLTNCASQDEWSFVLSIAVANSQYILESIWQSIVSYLVDDQKLGDDSMILIGGDGRLYNDVAMEYFLRVATANGIKNIHVAKRDELITAAAKEYLNNGGKGKSGGGRNSSGGSSTSSGGRNSMAAAIVLSAAGLEGGIKGFFGVTVYTAGEDIDGGHVKGLSFDDWDRIVSDVNSRTSVRIIPDRLGVEVVRTVSTADQLIVAFNNLLDLKTIGKFIKSSGMIVSFDCMDSVVSTYLNGLLAFMDLTHDENILLLNNKPKVDFGGKVPQASAVHAFDSVGLFDIAASSEAYSGPDLGFVYDSDGQDYLVLYENKIADAKNLTDLINSFTEYKYQNGAKQRHHLFDNGLFKTFMIIDMMMSATHTIRNTVSNDKGNITEGKYSAMIKRLASTERKSFINIGELLEKYASE